MRSSVYPWLILSCFLMSMLASCQQLVWLPPTVMPTSIAPLSVPQLKYALIESFGGMGEQGRGIHFCDPDVYPVGVGDEPEKAMTQFPAIKNDAELFQAIIEHLALEGQTEFTTDDQVRIYREYKKLQALNLDPTTTPYTFQLGVTLGDGQFIVNGTVTHQGLIAIRTREPARLECPICLPKGSLIATPQGEVTIDELQIGMTVWTMDLDGTRRATTVKQLRRVPLLSQHHFVRIGLSDGRVVLASPAHPLADGQRFAEIKPGDRLDGAEVVTVDLVPAGDDATYDILPGGDTGVYWANGVRLQSTLHVDNANGVGQAGSASNTP